MTLRRILRLVVLLATAAAAFWVGLPQLPDRWSPWAPLRLSDPPNLLTGFKLRRLGGDPAACRAVLDQADFTYTPVADRKTGSGCGFRNAVRIERGDIAYGGGFVATCPLAVALELFERHALQPAAEAVFGQPVVAIEHLGSYACRNVGNRPAGRRSQHASANALDIAGVVLRDGTRVTLASDWDGGGAKAGFLRRARDGACEIFGVVLGPDYDAAHRTHLHVDLSRASLCR